MGVTQHHPPCFFPLLIAPSSDLSSVFPLHPFLDSLFPCSPPRTFLYVPLHRPPVTYCPLHRPLPSPTSTSPTNLLDIQSCLTVAFRLSLPQDPFYLLVPPSLPLHCALAALRTRKYCRPDRRKKADILFSETALQELTDSTCLPLFSRSRSNS